MPSTDVMQLTFTLLQEVSGGSRGRARLGVPPLFLDQTEAPKGEKCFWTPPPLLTKGLDVFHPPPPPPHTHTHTHTHTLISRSGSGTAACSRIRCQQQCFVNNPKTTLARMIILPPPTCVLTYNYTRITLRIYVLASLRRADAFLGFCLLPAGSVSVFMNFTFLLIFQA